MNQRAEPSVDAATSRGDAWRLGTVLSFGTMYPRDTYPEGAYFQSEGSELEAQARVEIPRVVNAALGAAGWVPDSVEAVASHQHSRKLIQELVVAVGIPTERAMLPIRYAHAVSANVPLALAEAQREGLLRPGARVLLCAGSGFSAMAMAVSW